MKITAIKAQVKNPERVSIFIDGKYNFSLTQNQLLSAGLRIGTELDNEALQKLKDDSEFGKAYMRALEYIMRRPRSEKEIRNYAWRKKWLPEMIEQIIEKLKAKKYLDDENFARVWIRHRALGKPISKRKLQLELMQKGLDSETINQSLAASGDFDETAALKELIKKKAPRYTDEVKLKQYLLRQGFSYDQIKQALEDAA